MIYTIGLNHGAKVEIGEKRRVRSGKRVVAYRSEGRMRVSYKEIKNITPSQNQELWSRLALKSLALIYYNWLFYGINVLYILILLITKLKSENIPIHSWTEH